METKAHNAGQDNNQFQGMNPVKPGIFLKAPVKVKANTINQWA
jgi:hypothetical protein